MKYEKPFIVKVGNPLYAKHGASAQSYQLVRNSIDNVNIKKLTEEYGSPLFVFSEKTIEEKYFETFRAIEKHYPKVCFGWSYKTNYLNAICQLFHSYGSVAEVVSEFEYDKARANGIPGDQIIFNGPLKSKEGLQRAIDEGAQIHIDHFGELNDLEELTENRDREVKVGIRINLSTGPIPQWSRFGFNLESGQAWEAVKRLKASKKLKLVGLHTHIGTFVLDAAAYNKAATKMMSFMGEVEGLLKYQLEFLDFGGGFASLNHLKGIYQPPELVVPSAESYAEQLCAPLQPLLARENPPMLYMELGRHLIDEAGYLVTSIVADKVLADGRRAYVIDAGVNFLYTATWYKFKIELDQEMSGTMEPCLLNGPLCMNIDIVDESIMLPRLNRGQQMTISPVGAYNVTQWMQFIRYRPAVVLVRKDGSVNEIRRAEKLDDLNSLERRIEVKGAKTKAA